MTYTCYLATQEDTAKIVPLMAAFSQERAAIDPTRTLKPDFNFEGYISDRINKPLHYFWLLERCGFTRTAVQYTCHFNLSPSVRDKSL